MRYRKELFRKCINILENTTPVILLKTNEKEILETLKKTLEFLGFRSKGTVLVKPNICMPYYVPGAVTSPQLLRELVGLLCKTAKDVIVAESDGYNYSCTVAFRKTGIETAVKSAGGRILNLSRDRIVRVNVKNSQIKNLLLPKTLLEVDALVNVPVMKTHEFTLYSGAIKNLFGLIPDNRRIFLHPYINETLYHLLTLPKSIATIMDSLTAMEGRGPTRGTPVKLNLIMASNSPLALDITATKIMRLNWREVRHLAYIAQKTGFKEETIKTLGCSIEEFARNFALPKADLPAKLQHKIFQHELLTRILFCNTGFIKLCQKLLNCYRKLPIAA